ncbi:MAG: RNA polymerase sigma factor [Candidatus Levyibacteriota bacterium]
MGDLKTAIQRAQDGNREAYGEIYKLYYKKIFRYCSFNTRDNSAAQDICQETFVKAWKKIKDFNMERADWSFQAFLFAIARNLIIDRTREKKEYSLEAYEDIETNEDYYEALDKKNDAQKLKKALSKLDEVERQIIMLRYFEEMGSKEVANILEIKEGALRVRQSRILQKLKNIMEVLYGSKN